MIPIVGTSAVVNGSTQWGLAVDNRFVVLIERAEPEVLWRHVKEWQFPEGPEVTLREWIKTVLVPALNGVFGQRFGSTPAPAPTAKATADVLAELLPRAVQFNYTARVYSYVPPDDPNNV